MLLVKTYLKQSNIHGIGVFAKNDIPRGTPIWRYSRNIDRVYSKYKLGSMNGIEREFMETYCFKYHGKYYLCVDDARFMNHSDRPNCIDIGEDNIKSIDIGYTMADRDIKAGEELTCDYKGFGATEDDLTFNVAEFVK